MINERRTPIITPEIITKINTSGAGNI